ncbi:S-layer homology domain-containing protein [Candidatus Margulisiibacteriota bacterium]
MKNKLIFVLIIVFIAVSKLFSAEPLYRFGVSPYAGYHSRTVREELDSGIEIGFKAGEYFTKDFSMELGFGFIFPQNIKNKKYSIYRTFTLQALHNLISLNPLHLYVTGGLMMDFGKIIVDTNGLYVPIPTVGAGVGLRLNLPNEFGLRTEVFTTNRELATVVAIEKYFVPVAASEFNVNAVWIDLKVPSKISLFKSEKMEFNDIAGHWAESDIKAVTQLGLIKEKHILPTEGEEEVMLFMPSLPILKKEAVKMVFLGTKLHEIISENLAPIEFEIKGSGIITYKIDLYVTDKHKKPVKKLLEGQSVIQGSHFLRWEGTDDSFQPLPEDEYFVNLDLNFKNRKIRKKRIFTKIVYLDQPKIEYEAEALTFDDIEQKNDYFPIINEAVDMGLFDILIKKDSSEEDQEYYFEPETNISKFDYIVSIGRALSYLGVEFKILPDFSPIKDMNFNNIPEDDKKYFGVYVNVFGYGVDAYGKFYPDKLVSRAEATVLINRFLRWKKGEEDKPGPFQEQKLETKLVIKEDVKPKAKKVEPGKPKTKEEVVLAKAKAIVRKQEKAKAKAIAKKLRASKRTFRKKTILKPMSANQLVNISKQGSSNPNRPLTYRVIVGSFLTDSKANKYLEQMKQFCASPYIWERKSGKRKKKKYSLYTIHLASFNDLKIAKKYMRQLNARNISAYIANYY